MDKGVAMVSVNVMSIDCVHVSMYIFSRMFLCFL